MSEIHTCPTCFHQSTAYWCRLSLGLVNTLVKIRGAVGAKNSNSVHLTKDMTGDFELTKNEYNNAQKLRYHGLIAHSDEGAGYWLITRRGGAFLRGELSVPLKVKSLNNRVIEHDDLLVSIQDVRKSLDAPVFDDRADFLFEAERQPLELKQVALL